jgi:hypothetical protein
MSLELSPAFCSPLTDKQHARLGRIAVLWGHIDFILDELLLKVLRLTRGQRAALIGEKPIGPKLEMLKPGIAKIKDPVIQEKVRAFYTILNDTKAQRNHIFHGSWGWRAIDRGKRVSIAARHPKSPTSPVEVDKLPGLERELCRASRLGIDAYTLFRKDPLPTGSMRYLHGSSKQPRKWFLRWFEQHPLDAASWDRSCKEGELPRLIDPLG